MRQDASGAGGDDVSWLVVVKTMEPRPSSLWLLGATVMVQTIVVLYVL